MNRIDAIRKRFAERSTVDGSFDFQQNAPKDIELLLEIADAVLRLADTDPDTVVEAEATDGLLRLSEKFRQPENDE